MIQSLAEKRDHLLDLIRKLESCVVAFSGGVDSAVVAKAAHLALGDRAVAVTRVSPSLASGEFEVARQVAQQIGIRHEIIQTNEMEDVAFTQNATDRCYHCKIDLYDHLEALIRRLGVKAIINGANADDLNDYRPGTTAGTERGVRSPLAECGITKTDVRMLAQDWGLVVWNKPAAPCLASRIAYGEAVTAERLARIDAAEQFLRSFGLQEVRVRYHRGNLARIEVPATAVCRISEPAIREQIIQYLKSLGFIYITLDLDGFRSGSLNEILEIAE
ncbi:MAG: ATP-dependent sacrificial sulfur transferase LarE [Pirellulales bacterium]|nr:ATP-dependent sacrificial sulfur transferase LarE [Pirellulales bacterium]